jgi:uncharacterized protein
MIFKAESRIPCPAEELFRWHEHPDAFRRLMPPGEPVKVLRHDGKITNGARAILLVGFWPLRFRWELEHRDYIAGRQFCDVQLKGPFKSYRHEHVMTPDGDDACILTDTIHFEMPAGPLGRLLGHLVMLPKFRRLFAFRHRVTREAFGA